MQANLETTELAFVLHSLNAEKVVGLDNDQLFPADELSRHELLTTGRSRLQANGWFAADENGRFNSEPQLVLMVAVMVDPQLIFTVDRRSRDKSIQQVTYYVSGPHLIEQFRTQEGSYLLSRLPDMVAVITRWQQLFPPGDAAPLVLQCDGAQFARARDLARAGNPAAMQDLVTAAGTGTEDDDALAAALAQLVPRGSIAGAAVHGPALEAYGELTLLEDVGGNGWMAQSAAEGGLLTLTRYTPTQFAAVCRQFFTAVATPV